MKNIYVEDKSELRTLISPSEPPIVKALRKHFEKWDDILKSAGSPRSRSAPGLPADRSDL